MAKRIGIFMDVSNLYYSTINKFKGRKLNYRKYLDYIKDLGIIVQSIAYGAQLKDEAKSFISCLSNMGFEIKYKKPKTWVNDGVIKRKADWDVGIAIDIVRLHQNFDLIVLGTADGDMAPVVKWLLEKGIKVIILGSGISTELMDLTRCIEIPESFMEGVK